MYKKDIPINIIQSSHIYILDKVGSKTNITRGKETHFMIKVSTHESNIIVLYSYALELLQNARSKNRIKR